jgi:DNA-binding PadR family transcriptional regulator
VSKRRKVGNLLALAVLSYLTRGPMHPYELSRTLREHGDDRSIKFNHSSLYMVFGQLVQAGFLVAQETEREGQRPERTIYAITDAGREELRAWMRELVEDPQHEFPHFVAALSLLAVLPPDEAVDLLNRRLARLGEQRIEIRHLIETTLAAGVHPLFQVEEDYRLALLDAEAAFVERLIERITNPATGWAPLWASFHSNHPDSKDLE